MAQNPVQYATVPSAPQAAADESHLRVLAILYFVWGGLALLWGLFCIIYIVFGVVVLKNPGLLATPTLSGPPGTTPAPSPPPPDTLPAYFIITFGVLMLFLGVLIGGLSILSGAALMRRRRRRLILVTAGLTCLAMPIGTVLGVFTFIVMLRPSVKATFAPSPTT